MTDIIERLESMLADLDTEVHVPKAAVVELLEDARNALEDALIPEDK